MSLEALVKAVGYRCARAGISVYGICAKHGIPDDQALSFLRMQARPSDAMLRAIAKELEMSVDDLRGVLER